MFVRYSIATMSAAAAAFALFFLMQALIAVNNPNDDTRYKARPIVFGRIPRSEQTQEKRREPPQKMPADSNPAPPPMSLPSTSIGGPVAVAIATPSVDQRIDISGGPTLGSAPSDTDIIPLVRIEPEYPQIAREQKIEGWVEFEFTISATGAVKDAKVVTAKPPAVFERAALRAIRKWRYKPRIEDGRPVERKGVRVVLAFKLADEE